MKHHRTKQRGRGHVAQATKAVTRPSSPSHTAKVITRFGSHTTIGFAVFMMIAVPAILLELGVYYLAFVPGVTAFAISVLSLLAHVILVCDSALFLRYLAVTAYRAIMSKDDDENHQ